MTSGPAPRSFDPARMRPVPRAVSGRGLSGDLVEVALASPTLIVAVKTGCDGCRPFVLEELEELADVAVLVVSATDDPAGEWRAARRAVVVAPDLLEALDVRWPPFFVLVDPVASRVLVEGVVFAPAQVAAEIAPHLV